MLKIPVVVWIANAATRLAGAHRDVTPQAEAADCSRQTVYDHAQKVQAAVEAEHSGGPTRAELRTQNHLLQRENAQLWDWLAQTIEFPKDKQRQFTVIATAMGLSLNQVLALLALILGVQARPGRATLHRGIKAAGIAAGRVLKHLDARCQALVLIGCLDASFFRRRPVLVGVEPASMVWFWGQRANDRTGATWSRALQDFPALSYVVADAGTGLQAGIAAVQQQRHKDGQPPLENGLDVFHTTQEARRVLRPIWSPVERLWDQAEAADRRVAQAQQPGHDARGAAVAARWAWQEAATAFPQYERSEAGWKIAHAALHVLRPNGRLNERPWAQVQSARTLPQLSGREWSKVRNSLQAEETLTFLDRLHRQLQEVAPEAPLRRELVRLWWLRRQRPRATTAGRIAGVGHVAHLVQRVVCHRTGANWHGLDRAVARVLRQTVRASSAVECMNSVLRMHQWRHRTVTQGQLDLKRLYGNCRAFSEGKRRGRCPYEHLGLKLPSYRFWDLLWMPTPIGATT